MPDIDGIIRCSWCELSLFADDPDFVNCEITGEAHLLCHMARCYCSDLGLITA